MMGSEPEVMQLPAVRQRTPLAPYQLGAGATPEEARRFVAVVSAERTVMAALKCERRGFFSSDFVAKVVNDSDDDLSCSVTGWTHRGSVRLEPDYFWIKPKSVAQVLIRAPLRLPHRLRTIALHMQNATLRATAEADVPPPPVLVLAGVISALFAVALAGFLGWRSTAPSISAYTLPTQVAAGDRVIASYAYGGIGTAEYSVTSGGQEIAGGILTQRHGTFSFPTAKTQAFYHVTLSVVGPLGAARRQLLSQAIPFSAQTTALAIGALQPDPSVVRSGDKIAVRYITDAQSGTVTLYDASDIALQHTAYNQSGVSTLTAPNVDVPTQYRVELQVAGAGGKTARASAGLLVMPKEDGSDALPSPGNVLSADQLFRAPEVVESASTFGVRLLQHPDDLRLTLEDANGVALSTQSVSPGQGLVYFDAPNVSRDDSYLIVASFSQGNGDQVLIQHVLVRVR